MEGIDRYQRAKVEILSCGAMTRACIENANTAAKELPAAERRYADACQAVIDWEDSQGKLELQKRGQHKISSAENIVRVKSDKRYWLERTQAWRQCLLVHPELAGEEVGAECSHGYVAPMCVLDRPVLKSVPMREIGEDDE